MRLDGIHHITCVTGDARANLDFYTRVLGLRLVAKTVNQDDPLMYHLFYGDEFGHPGSDLTFFERPGVLRGQAGAGMVHRIAWRVGSGEALDFWTGRFQHEGLACERGALGLRFADPEGLEFELLVDPSHDRPLVAHHPEIPSELALLGFHGVRAYSTDTGIGRALLEGVLGAVPVADATWELRGSRRGATIAFDPAPADRPEPGAGTVHHVAWGATMADHPRWHERLRAAGIRATPIIDRYFFHSIYFREPNGVLFELADDGPGLARNESPVAPGSHLILPPRFEARRAEIESRLTPLGDPRASWAKPAARTA